MLKRFLIFALLTCASNIHYGQDTPSQPLSLTTPWTPEVNENNVLPEYPRPQLVRSGWTNLNGKWDYSITDSAATHPGAFNGKILVPYPIESLLSGVQKTFNPNQKLWYKRTLNITKLDVSHKQLLHFGAVDYEATIIVNGKTIGSHTGGYQEFTFDITGALHKGLNELVVSVTDPSDQGNNPHGKQILHPEGIMYTPSSGIWQTVWLETVPVNYINSLKMTPDIDRQCLNIQVEGTPGMIVTIKAMTAGTQVSSINGTTGQLLQLPVKDAHLWSPDDPFLYDLVITLQKGNTQADEVKSYFGMRKISIEKDTDDQYRIFLNNKKTYNLGVLDQGYWPDGLHTAPTDQALLWDVTTIKSMGFNTIRKHIKIEPARWYYHCDKTGLLVWQDMPFPANLSNAAKAEYEKENAENIQQLYNYPSIICWVLFNEGWMRYDQKRLTEWMQQADPSRLINGHSGENYDRSAPKSTADRWIGSDMTDIHDYPGPGIPVAHPGKARVLGEWGGIRVVTPGHQWNAGKGWGYIESASKDFARQYEFMLKHLKIYKEEGLGASIYTQPFDVETEENGLITYDRKVFKIPVEKIKAINAIMY